MGIAAAQIGFHHQTRDRLRVGVRQPGGDKRARYEIAERCCRDAGFGRHFLGPCVLIHFQSISNPCQSHDAAGGWRCPASDHKINRSNEVSQYGHIDCRKNRDP
ncbi:MAG: hypothetical protein WAR76_21855 [Xanthobacteraceae bacterium]